MTIRILVRGGGDLASGAIMRLYRAGWQVVVVELAQPRSVRLGASYSRAVYEQTIVLEGVQARLVETLDTAWEVLSRGEIPLLVDPDLTLTADYEPDVLVDARMLKLAPIGEIAIAPFVIGLGPGFTAGRDCHAVVETNRGPDLGRVVWQGKAQADTGIPERVGDYQAERVLRAPAEGVLLPLAKIGANVHRGDPVAQVQDALLRAPFPGVLRGMMMGGLVVHQGEKIGDLDPRGDPNLCWKASDKALAIGGGVLEAILTWQSGRYPAHRPGEA